ncbi:MAG: competence/damage-inducible protein A [Bryobacteraceae bacterium]|nr:competence/damage-inducible protein A [Bryobacteraceae bacterium]
MNAEIIAVGSEMLTPQRIDTNSLYLTDQLNAYGVEVVYKCVVGDDRALLTDSIRLAVNRSAIVILSGGLGPTEDDLTRDAVAAALGVGQTYHPDVFAGIEGMFARLGRKVAENNKRQAMLIDGAEWLENTRGTAPGQWIRTANGVVILLPGPPKELTTMYERTVRERLVALLPKQALRTRWYRVAGMGESDLDQLIAPVYTRYTNPVTTVLAKAGDIEVHLRARLDTAEAAEALVNEVGVQVEALLGDRIYSHNGDPLEKTVGLMLAARGATVAVAESCTGGLLGTRLSDTPGASAWFRGGYIVYTLALKQALAGDADGAAIAAAGVVSETTATVLAKAAAARSGATYGVSITGVAGPDGGTGENPVGTVWIAVASNQSVTARRYRFPGDRGRVRTLAAQSALDLLRRHLLSEKG